MTEFVRHPAPRWHEEVPGARWVRVDLHVHTLDDHPCTGLRRPVGLAGDPSDSATQVAYAKALLRAAVAARVEVIGLTPHAVRSGAGDATSATWEVVRVWNEEQDDDGVPFRDKVYAVFPGFEPSFTEGKSGVHLQFLFDPEVGREFYLSAFQALMQGATPWKDGNLQNTRLEAKDAFAVLDGLCEREGVDTDAWICLAPHAFGGKGILNAVRGQVAADFPCWHRIAALELPDGQLPSEVIAERPWLAAGLARFRHGLFHSSDAYSFAAPGSLPQQNQLGNRVTLLKLGSPTIAALRQAFLASDSRLRNCYVRTDGAIVEDHTLPNPTGADRPWVRQVTVAGGTSFFGGVTEGVARRVVVRFSPGLTCIIGGRMAGKSTLLDGLRVHCGLPLPVDDRVRKDVEGRAHSRFLSGAPEVAIDFGGQSAGDGNWPARFFTQRELQDAVGDQAGLRAILFRLIPGKAATLESQYTSLCERDTALEELVVRIEAARELASEAAQGLAEAQVAKEALQRYSDVGAQKLTSVQADVAQLSAQHLQMEELLGALKELIPDPQVWPALSMASPEVTDLLPADASDQVTRAVDGIREYLAAGVAKVATLVATLSTWHKKASDEQQRLTDEIVSLLVARGGSPEDLVAFGKYQTRAASFESDKQEDERCRAVLAEEDAAFARMLSERDATVEAHRATMTEVAAQIAVTFSGQIKIVTQQEAALDSLDDWIRGLAKKGVTRWWNARCEAGDAPGAALLFAAYDAANLGSLGMSEEVQESFTDAVAGVGLYSLRALRSPDLYSLLWRVSAEPETYRQMEELSGGQQVSLLLSLLLQTDDDRPLVIDQPEDELDTAYLFETVLPVLRRLKSRRQVIFSTHSANIVVNGDADQVVCLKADHSRGWVYESGAIENPSVRLAIVDTVDGGEEAFELRRLKYGF